MRLVRAGEVVMKVNTVDVSFKAPQLTHLQHCGLLIHRRDRIDAVRACVVKLASLRLDLSKRCLLGNLEIVIYCKDGLN